MRLKIESARRQLGTALALYLDDRDPVSVHCLAGGGCEVIDFWARKADGEPFVTHILDEHPHLNIASVRTLQRQFWNAFKHATNKEDQERADETVLANFSDEQNDIALFIGWFDYGLVTGTMPIEAQVHQLWYLSKNPEKANPCQAYDGYFPNINSVPRVEQKKRLREAIEAERSNNEVMSDPKTDARPLILPWPPC